MKIAVIGRDGQLARSLVQRAGFSGLELTAIGRDRLDLSDVRTIAPALEAERADVVINAAAYTGVDAAEDDEARAFAVNAVGAAEAARACAANGVRFIHISTDYVFDGTGSETKDETAAAAPLGVYGRSKLAGEQAVREADSNALIVRTSWVFSPFGKNFVKTMMGLAKDRDEIRVVDDQIGNPTSALDFAEGLLRAAEQGWGGGALYHLAGTGTASWAYLARAVMDECVRLGLPTAKIVPIPTSEFPTRAVRPRNSTMDSSRFASDFSFIMPDWRVSLRTVIEQIARG